VFTHIRRTRLGAGVVLAALLLAAGASSAAATTSANGPTAKKPTAKELLGKPNKATLSPIKIGLVGDGKNDILDDTPRLKTSEAVVKYANDYRGGLNGHVIDLVQCETKSTPAGGTQCGVEMVNKGVAAVIVGASGVNANIFAGLGTSGIPFFIRSATSASITQNPNAYVVTNTVATLSAPIALLQQRKLTKLAIVVVDSPEAVAAANIAIKPFYNKAGITLDVIPAPASTADLSPQIQQAISNGDQAILVIAVPRSLIAIKQSGFKGPVIVVNAIEKADAANVPGGVKGFYITTTTTMDPANRETQLMEAIMKKYAPDVVVTALTGSQYGVMLGFVDALQGATTAVDAKSIKAALDTMKPTKLPLGGGATFQCGTKEVPATPSACSSKALTGSVAKDGTPVKFTVVDTSQFLKL
jgi:branched-chain amino acid transport system substrate-binding protein